MVLAATALIIMLTSGAAQVGGQFHWVVFPVVVLLVVVVAFGLLSLLRSARRAAAGVHLAIDASAQLVSGFTARRSAPRLRVEPMSSLLKLEIEVRRGAGANSRDPRSWATLELSLKDGTRLEGPEAWGPDEQWEATEALLLPLARELSRLSGRPLEVRRKW